jgi:hypothetical protein
MIKNFVIKCATCAKLKKHNDPWIYEHKTSTGEAAIKIVCSICKTETVVYL